MDQSSGLKIKNGIITEYTGQNSDVIIPDNVKGISSAVFKDCHALRSVILPAGLETIDSRCFEGCDGLKTIMFSTGLKSIGKYAFAGCSNLKMHKLPAGLESVEAYAFKDCTSLTSMEIPASAADIGVGAFEGCVSLASIRIPGRYTGIGTAFGTHPFTGCDDLTIYAPVGTDAEKCGEDNGIPVINISAQGPVAAAGEKKESDEKAAISDALDAAYSKKQQASSKRPAAAEKVKFGFGTPESVSKGPAVSEAAVKAAAELQAAHQKELQDKENRRVYNEAAALYESGTEDNMQKAIDMMRSLGSFDDSRLRAKEFSKGLKKKQKDARKAEAERARQERLQAAEERKAAARAQAAELEKAAAQRRAAEQEAAVARKRDAELEKAAAREQAAELEKAAAQKRAAELEAKKKAAEIEAAARRQAAEAEKAASAPEKKSVALPKIENVPLPKPKISRKLAVILLVVVVAVGAGIGVARYVSTHNSSSGGSDYTLTLEDYINSNDAAKQQLVQSVEGTDVIISVEGNTLIYTYDLSASNSMTPEIAQSDELKQSLGETLDSSDEQFTELCAGLEKDTGISGVSVEVSFKYGNEVLLQRTYTSEGKQQ